MRVLHGIHWSHGGIVKLLELLLKNFSSPHIEHHVAVLDCDSAETEALQSWSRTYNSFSLEKDFVTVAKRYKQLLADLNPDVFHAHSFMPGLLGRLFLPQGAISVATIHNQYPHHSPKSLHDAVKLWLEHRSLRRCHAVVCVSESVRDVVDLAMPGLPTEVINNGIDLSACDDFMAERHAPHQNDHPLTVLSLGRLDDQKGYDLLLTAFALVLKRDVDASLRIVGEGVLRPALEAQARRLHIAERVFLPGFSTAPMEEFQKADIYVCSSRYEGFSLAVAEAMLHALPVITTKVGGIASMVRDGLDAVVVPMGDPAAMAEAMMMLLSHPDMRRNIGRCGRLFVKENFDIRTAARRYEALYERVSR